jgi:hypothetical protein
MQDMLCSLLSLPSVAEEERRLLETEHIVFRRAMVPDMMRIVDFVKTHASGGEASECQVCFSRQPVSLFIATRGTEILGYAAYEATARDYFGPTRVLEAERGKGIGKVLLVKALEGLREIGYAYAIIGGVGPVAFYEKSVGAMLIPDSNPGLYRDFLPLIEETDKK